MSNEPARLPPFEALRNELATLRRSPMVAMSGKAGVVDLLDAYLVSTEARLAALEFHAEHGSNCVTEGCGTGCRTTGSGIRITGLGGAAR